MEAIEQEEKWRGKSYGRRGDVYCIIHIITCGIHTVLPQMFCTTIALYNYLSGCSKSLRMALDTFMHKHSIHAFVFGPKTTCM